MSYLIVSSLRKNMNKKNISDTRANIFDGWARLMGNVTEKIYCLPYYPNEPHELMLISNAITDAIKQNEL